MDRFTKSSRKPLRKWGKFYLIVCHHPFSCGRTLVPWAMGEFAGQDLFSDRHTQALAWCLNYHNPRLLTQWFYDVLPAALHAKQEREAFKLLKESQREQRFEVEAEHRNLQEMFWASPKQITARWNRRIKFRSFDFEGVTRRLEPIWFGILSTGLSIMLIIGAAHVFRIPIRNPSLSQLPALFMAAFAGLCATLTVKFCVKEAVIAIRRDGTKN